MLIPKQGLVGKAHPQRSNRQVADQIPNPVSLKPAGNPFVQ
jgi:hypothetical protein